MKRLGFSVLIVVSACIPPSPRISPSAVSIARLSPQASSIDTCHVAFGWWLQELIDNCGAPDKWIVGTSDPSRLCGLYRDDGANFVGGSGAPFVAVCLDKHDPKRRPLLKSESDPVPLRASVSAPGIAADSLATYMVTQVVGLRSICKSKGADCTVDQ